MRSWDSIFCGFGQQFNWDQQNYYFLWLLEKCSQDSESGMLNYFSYSGDTTLVTVTNWWFMIRTWSSLSLVWMNMLLKESSNCCMISTTHTTDGNSSYWVISKILCYFQGVTQLVLNILFIISHYRLSPACWMYQREVHNWGVLWQPLLHSGGHGQGSDTLNTERTLLQSQSLQRLCHPRDQILQHWHWTHECSGLCQSYARQELRIPAEAVSGLCSQQSRLSWVWHSHGEDSPPDGWSQCWCGQWQLLSQWREEATQWWSQRYVVPIDFSSAIVSKAALVSTSMANVPWKHN